MIRRVSGVRQSGVMTGVAVMTAVVRVVSGVSPVIRGVWVVMGVCGGVADVAVGVMTTIRVVMGVKADRRGLRFGLGFGFSDDGRGHKGDEADNVEGFHCVMN